jgi:hypothetical protein
MIKRIMVEMLLFIETKVKMIPDHLRNVEVVVEFPLRRRKSMKIMPGEKSIAELRNIDKNSKYRVHMFRVIIDNILEVESHSFTNNSNLSFSSFLFPGHKYF